MNELQEFSEQERRLRQELRRIDAPAGFAERVMQRAESADERTARSAKLRGKAQAFRDATAIRWRGWISGVAAAAAVAGVLVGVRVQEVHRAQQVQRQFDAAMRVTGETLEKTREQLQRAGVQLGNE